MDICPPGFRGSYFFALATAGLLAMAFPWNPGGDGPPDYDKAGIEAARLVDIDSMKSAVDYLASDSLEGRETGEPGQTKAAKYIAGQFRLFGLKPLGDSGTYFQHFFVDISRISDSSYLRSGGKYFWGSKDFLVMPFTAADTSVTAQIIFAGYGYEDGSYSDYKGMDVTGKIVMLLGGNPKFADTNDVMVRTGLYKMTNAVSNGAAAVIMTINDGDEGFARLRKSFNATDGVKQMSLASEIGKPAQFKPVQLIYIRESIADSILLSRHFTSTRLARRIDSLKVPVSLQLGKATVSVRIDRETRETENVVAVLGGTDTLLDSRYMVYSAHYDHLGMTPDCAVFHGADDNASGTATVLEIARAYALSTVKPRRSVVFLTVSGEEEGLLGSKYFTSHSPIPLDSIVADINTDMDGRIDPAHEESDSNYIYVIGSKRLSNELDSLLVAADSESVKLSLDYRYDAENDPNRFYYRSDSYSFARHKVPTIFFFNGVHTDYHKPSDTSDKIAFSVMHKRAILILLTGWKAANLSWRLMPN